MPHSTLDSSQSSYSATAVDNSANNISPHSKSQLHPMAARRSNGAMSYSTHSEAKHKANNITLTSLAELMSTMEQKLNEKVDKIDKDLNKLKQGGWTVAIGPFTDQDKPSSSIVEGKSSKTKTTQADRPLSNLNGGAVQNGTAGSATDRYHALTDSLAKSAFVLASDRTNGSPPVPAEQNAEERHNGQLNSGTQTSREGLSTIAGQVPGEPTKGAGDKTNTGPIASNSITSRVPPHLAGKTPNGALKETTPTCSPCLPPVNAVLPSKGEIDGDTPVPSVEDHAMAASGTYQPLAIRRLPRLDLHGAIPLPDRMQTFSGAFLHKVLGGNAWSPGLYLIDPKSTMPTSLNDEGGVGILLPSKTYYLMSRTTEPFLPKEPGQHGAKLTAFFRNVELEYDEGSSAYLNVPLFISEEGKSVYTYCGNYSQLRWSDKLDHDRLVEVVPDHVKMHIAETLTEVGRPEWVTRELMEHFWPKPDYIGMVPSANERATTVTNTGHDTKQDEQQSDAQGVNDGLSEELMLDMKDHIEELVEWERDASIKAGLLKKENILEAFEREDAADPPGLRLWWEYLQCVGWDDDFYQLLVRLKDVA